MVNSNAVISALVRQQLNEYRLSLAEVDSMADNMLLIQAIVSPTPDVEFIVQELTDTLADNATLFTEAEQAAMRALLVELQ